MSIPKIATIDFETEKIKPRPEYPPKPVGVAIKAPGLRSKYYSWAHPVENNSTKSEAQSVLRKLYSQYPILCHNAKFDLDVAHAHLGLPLIPKYGYHDTEFLAFLDDPHADKLALKPLSEKYLDIPPDEQDILHEWIESHIFLSSKFSDDNYKIYIGSEKPKGYLKVPKNNLGAFIAQAPGKLVGKYAIGDINRTEKLFKLLYKKVISERGMGDAYQRELKLMPILLKNEKQGVKVSQKNLRKTVKNLSSDIVEIDNWIRRKLKNKDINIDSADELADALEHAGFIGDWVLTAKGNRSISKDNLPLAVNNQSIVDALAFRSKLKNIHNTFANPWMVIAERNNGFIHCNWSQVRNTDETGRGSGGARTGRIQSSPNFQAIPKKSPLMPVPKSLMNKLVHKGSPPPMRSFVIPDSKEHVFGHRDYSQQELRILGHFEDGPLLQAYLENPRLDLHSLATQLVNDLLNSNFERRPIKDMAFGILYGVGLAKLAQKMGVDTNLARTLRKAYLDIFPGLKELIDDLYALAKSNSPFKTWGLREYFCEEPAFVKKFDRVQTFEYKMINYLIQGSAADCTKEAIIRVDEACKNSRMLITVHDEINMSMPKFGFWKEMKIMREAMESIEFDVPLLSDGGMSSKSWQDVKDFTPHQIKKYGV